MCGLAPALQTRRTPLVASLTDRSRVAAGGSVRLRKVLVAGQLAFTLVLLVGSGLFVQTVTRLHGNLGFDSGNLVTVSVDPPANGYSEPDAERVIREVLQRLQAVPVVERAAVANSSMLTGGMASTMRHDPERPPLRRGPRGGAHACRSRLFRGARHAGDRRARLRRARCASGRRQAARLSIGDRERELRAALLQGSESDRRPHRPRHSARYQDHHRDHRRGEGLQPAHAARPAGGDDLPAVFRQPVGRRHLLRQDPRQRGERVRRDSLGGCASGSGTAGDG